ncbi:MAG: hypothetical protein CMK82_11265 [Pseudomonadales bacterium]|uniref:hypothetical protein n=1 Tax=Sphingobium sp. TaxID=1912891 RepID=UPI000C4F379A|nr:hypothetical protein [Sphingobium sp.]MAS67359.1 hypothetical protein [Pseudomonadales bacterium]MBS90854.1 hypothetical protein [Sphingobium sp.]
MKTEYGTMNAGILIDTIRGAVLNAGAVPETEIKVRIGEHGPVYHIKAIKGQKDQRGLRLIIETEILPDLTDG